MWIILSIIIPFTMALIQCKNLKDALEVTVKFLILLCIYGSIVILILGGCV